MFCSQFKLLWDCSSDLIEIFPIICSRAVHSFLYICLSAIVHSLTLFYYITFVQASAVQCKTFATAINLHQIIINEVIKLLANKIITIVAK